MKPALVLIGVVSWWGLGAGTLWAEPQGAQQITLSVANEHGKQTIKATIQGPGVVEGRTVTFFAQRAFGLLRLGDDDAAQDGTVRYVLPEDLPGDATGHLTVVAQLEETKNLPGLSGSMTIPWGKPIATEQQDFPRALWSPRAPGGMVVVIVSLLAIVWGTYGFVGYHLAQIPRSVNENRAS